MDIHRSRFVPFAPSAINCLAFSHSSGASSRDQPLRLAIGRANGDIEIWDPARGAWVHETTIRGGKGRSCEGLVWIHDPDTVEDGELEDESGNRTDGFRHYGRARLFSIGYSSAVTEWDLCTGLPRRESSGVGGEVWCLAAQPAVEKKNVTSALKTEDKSTLSNGTHEVVEGSKEEAESTGYQGQHLVAGCADGTLVLLSTEDDQLVFKRYIARAAKKNARALSLAFKDRHTVVVGFSDSTVRIYDIRNGAMLRNMSLGAGPQGGPKEKLVWAVECLANGTIVSGDSSGEVIFWDGKTYGQLQRIKGHEADTLCLASSVDGNTVFSGGMDRRTCIYKISASNGQRKTWAKMTHRRFHQHDVKTMARFENKKMSVIVSGGLDTSPVLIPLRDFGKENHRTLPFVPQLPPVTGTGRLIVSWKENEVTIWHINEQRGDIESAQILAGEPNYRVASRMILKGDEHVSSAVIAPSGNVMAVATVAQIKLFQLVTAKGVLKIKKIDGAESMSKLGARLLQFSPDSKWLLFVDQTNSASLARLNHSEGRVSCLSTVIPLRRLSRRRRTQDSFNGEWGSYNRTITRCAFSAGSNILALSDMVGYIDTFILEGSEDLSAPATANAKRHDSAPMSPPSSVSDGMSDSSSGSDSDGAATRRKSRTITLYNQSWRKNPASELLPRLQSQALVMSFRPTSGKQLHDGPNDRLLIVTATHELREYSVLEAKLTDWSRRNPSKLLPEEFKLQRDRAMGCVWDLAATKEGKRKGYEAAKERVWLYGASWLCMFDLAKDFPRPTVEEPNGHVEDSKALVVSNRKKRKRSEGTTSALESKKGTSGAAGSKMRTSEQSGQVGSIRKPTASVRPDSRDPMVWEEIQTRRDGAADLTDDDEDDDGYLDTAILFTKDGEVKGEALTKRQPGAKIRPDFFITQRYRPILGIVPLSSARPDADVDDDDGGVAVAPRTELTTSRASSQIEVALIERPFWGLELPPRFSGPQDWEEK